VEALVFFFFWFLQYPLYDRSGGLKAEQISKAGRLNVQVKVSHKRFPQQDSVESLQSDREPLEKELFLLVNGKDRKDVAILWPKSSMNYCADDSLIRPKSFQSNRLEHDRPWQRGLFVGRRHLGYGASWGCRGWNVSVSQRGSDCNVPREGQTYSLLGYQCQTVRAFAVTMKVTRMFLRPSRDVISRDRVNRTLRNCRLFTQWNKQKTKAACDRKKHRYTYHWVIARICHRHSMKKGLRGDANTARWL